MERFYPIPTKNVHGKKAIISACQKKSPGKPSKTGRFLGGIRLSGLRFFDDVLFLRKKSFYVFLSPNQFLHLVQCHKVHLLRR